MSVFDVISLAGGLALFIYGMTVMSSGLERTSGGKLEQTLEKMSSNIVIAVLLGALVTGIIQSSSATTVILVGLVNARIITLRQSIGIIMGANIGTTVTAHILRLTEIDAGTGTLLGFFKPTTLAPLAATAGVLLYMIAQKNTRRDIGHFLIGFGVLFTGLFAMEGAVSSLRESPALIGMFTGLSNPILGVLAGMGVTAIIQSSSASVGILQALTVTGAVTASAAFPIILGQNIGTCITPVLASIGASKNAKRTAFVHVSFNVIGTVLFLTGLYVIQHTVGLPFWDEPISKGGIADFHTLFNVTVTLVLMPFAAQLEKLAHFFIKSGGDGEPEDMYAAALDERFLGSPAYAVSHAREAVLGMAKLAQENYRSSIELVRSFDRKKLERAREVEDIIDHMQSRVDQYLLKLGRNDMTETDAIALSEVLQVVNEYERVGDHADNICNCAEALHVKGVDLSASAKREIGAVAAAVEEILQMAVRGFEERDISAADSIEPLEDVIDMLVETLKVNHNERLRRGDCSMDAAFPYIEILYNMERIADHCSNIGVHIVSYSPAGPGTDRHEFLREMHRSQSPEFRAKFEMYDRKYFESIERPE